MASDVTGIDRSLDRGELPPEAALAALVPLARDAPQRTVRLQAWRVVGDIAGRAYGASWKTAEEAAWTLLELARHVDAPLERRALLEAMGHGFRNIWLLPFVHARLADPDPRDAAAAIRAAGGLGFAGLEAALTARFLGPPNATAPEVVPPVRRAAIASLGRMGALSAVPSLVARLASDPEETTLVLTALTEIHTPAGATAALGLLEDGPDREVLLAATRYLAALGREEVLPTLRRLARHEDPEMRMAASLAARALKAERNRDATERILAALTETDRAVRSLLARRLRTLPVNEVLAQAELLLDDDPRGILMILGEVRTPEVSRFLLAIAGRRDLPSRVRSRAALSVEADEPWEREGLVALLLSDDDPEVRTAATITLGAFASLGEVLDSLAPLAQDASPELRGALLWALQLAATPTRIAPAERSRCEALLHGALEDPDAFVRRRAAYVAGNLGLEGLAPSIVALARAEQDNPALRVASFVGAGELAAAPVLDELVTLWRREQEPQAQAAASRAIAQILGRHPDLRPADPTRLSLRLGQLLSAPDPLVRRAALRLVACLPDAVPATSIVALAQDRTPGIREEVLTALTRTASPEADAILEEALADVDPAVRERAAEALLTRGGLGAFERLVAHVSAEDDPDARAAIATRLRLPAVEAPTLVSALDAALGRLSDDDPVTEPLLALKVQLLERAGAPAGEAEVDAAITAAFPTYARLRQVRGFDPLGRSLRTAEALCRTAGTIRDGDLSPPIALWVKVLEGYLHAWLAPRLESLQREPAKLWDHVERLLDDAWPAYQRYLQTRWSDPVDLGGTRVELPLRAVPNVLRELQERRTKRVDQPLSVTQWARMLLLLGVDHPSGVRNLLRVTATTPDHVVGLAHRLLALAAVRNVVTHRSAAGPSTLDAFRRSYYAAFEDLTRLA